MSLQDAPHNLRLPEPTPAEAGEGQQAVAEAAAMAGGIDLSSRAALNNFNRLVRGDKAETHVHRIFICGAWVVATGIFASIALLFFHKLAPESLRFLTPAQVNDVYQFLFTGTMGGIIFKGGEYLNRK